MKKLLFILLMFAIGLAASAKPGKIKYGKFLVYEGEIVDKQPSGGGVLRAVNPSDKKEDIFRIAGMWNGTNVSNPYVYVISQDFMPNMNVKGDVQIEVTGKVGKTNSFNLILNNVLVVSKIQDKEATPPKKEFSIDKLTLKLSVMDSKWSVSYEGDDGEVKGTFDNIYSIVGNDQRKNGEREFYGFRNATSVPTKLLSLGYKTNKEHLALRIHKNRFIIDDSYYDLANNAYVYYNNVFVNSTSKYFRVGILDWVGVREFTDGTTVKKDKKGKAVVICYGNQKRYEGTVMGDVLSLVEANCDMQDVKYKDGYLYDKDNVGVRYLFGEPYDSLHKRLQSEMSEELVEDVESGKLTEAEAIKHIEQIRQEEEMAQQAKEKEESLRKMLNSRWNADAILFEGNITCTQAGSDAWRTYFGINPAYFTGKAMLGFDCYGVASFVFVPEPSRCSSNGGRGRVLQVNSFCQKLTNVIEKGDYRIEEHTLYVDNKEFGTFSSDWKTFTHEEQGMLKSVMKVTKKEHISADGKKHTFSSK